MTTPRKSHRSLIKQLNALLDTLHLPFHLQSPVELTPSLLIAILNRLAPNRLPLDFLPRGRSTDIQSMKIFLGVLENDVIKQDVGLSDLDPRRLANGDWDEVVYVGELLCWYASSQNNEHSDYETDNEEVNRAGAAYSPSTTAISIATKKTGLTTTTSTLSLHRQTESNTSMNISLDALDVPEYLHSERPTRERRSPSPPRPHCIHEIPSPSVILSPDLDSSFLEQSFCNCPEPAQAPSVRYSGYIEPVDEELELLSFETNWSLRETQPHMDDDLQESMYTQLREGRTYTIFLLNERARLLEELADIKAR